MTIHGTLTIPEGRHVIASTAHEDIDAALRTLAERRAAWVGLDVEGRIALLEELIETTHAAAPAWALAAAEAKGIPSRSPLMGEDWISGPALTLRNLLLLRHTLRDIADTGRPQPKRFRVAESGQVIADVAPINWLDQILLPGFSAEVRFQEGVTLEQAEAEIGLIYRRDPGERQGGVALVLGAGNVSSIPAMDTLYELFAEDRVVLLKMNPVNEHLGPHLAEALEPLVRAGFLRIVYGGADEGRYLTHHELVDKVHITGSDKTHDAIVFGNGPEGAARKERGETLFDKPITSELGSVSPVIVVPGPWSASDIAFHGDNLASMLVQNGGFNCIAARVIVTHRSWAKRRALLDAVRDSLRRAEPRVPYYPGAVERWRTFVDAHKQAEWFGEVGDDHVPFTLIPDLDPEDEEATAFTTEAFCGVFGEVGLDAQRSIPAYLDAAVDFVNERLWGTLSASIIVHPRSMRDPAIAAAVERAIDRLRYGSVVINHWSAVPYGMVSTTWGAYPGHELTDIQSGRGVVHNSFLLDHVEKSVCRGPFRTPIKPVWFHTHRTLHRVGPAVVDLYASEDPRKLPRLLAIALRG